MTDYDTINYRLHDIEERLDYLEEDDKEEFHTDLAKKLEKINERLYKLERQNEWESKLNEVLYKRSEKSMENESPEVRARVKKNVEEVMKELNDCQK